MRKKVKNAKTVWSNFGKAFNVHVLFSGSLIVKKFLLIYYKYDTLFKTIVCPLSTLILNFLYSKLDGWVTSGEQTQFG